MNARPDRGLAPQRAPMPRMEFREPADLTHDVVGGLAWSFLGTTGQALVKLLVLGLLARLLAPVHFGVVGAALIVVTLGGALAQLGVGPAIVQRPGLGILHVRAGFTLSILFGAAIAGLVWLLGPALAGFFRIPDLAPVMRALALTFLIQGPSVVAESILLRQLQFRRLAVIDLVAYGAGYGAVGLSLALMGLGAWALVGAQLAEALVRTAVVLRVQPHAKRPLLARRPVVDLLNYGGGFTVARIANLAANQADNLVVGRWLGAEALGIYGRAYQLMVAPAMFMGEGLDRVLFPVMVRVQAAPRRLGRAYQRSAGVIALVMLPASGVLVVLAPELIEVVLGSSWRQVTLPFQILAMGLLLRTSYKISDALVRATGAVYRRAWRQVLYAGLVAAGAWLGQPAGLAGVAAGVLAAITLNFLIMAHLSCSLAAVTWGSLWSAHRPAVVLAAGATAVAWVIASLTREWGLPPPAVLALSLAGVGGFAFLVLRWAPRATLGGHGEWMLRTLSERLAPGHRGPRRRGPLVGEPLPKTELGIP